MGDLSPIHNPTPMEPEELFTAVAQNGSYSITPPFPEPLGDPLPVPIELDLSPVISNEEITVPEPRPRPRAVAFTEAHREEDNKLIDQVKHRSSSIIQRQMQEDSGGEGERGGDAANNANNEPDRTIFPPRSLRRCSSETFLVLLKTLTEIDKDNIEMLAENSQRRQRRQTMEEHRNSIQNDDILQHLQSKEEADEFSLNVNLDLKILPNILNGNTFKQHMPPTFGDEEQPGPSYNAAAPLHEPADEDLGSKSRSTGVKKKKKEEEDLLASEQQQQDADKAKGKKDHKRKKIVKKTTRAKRPLGPSVDDMKVKRDSSLALMDERKARRIQANRNSAGRSRVRKLEFIKDLHASVEKLRKDLSFLEPQLQMAKAQQTNLEKINEKLKLEMEKRLNEKF